MLSDIEKFTLQSLATQASNISLVAKLTLQADSFDEEISEGISHKLFLEESIANLRHDAIILCVFGQLSDETIQKRTLELCQALDNEIKKESQLA